MKFIRSIKALSIVFGLFITINIHGAEIVFKKLSDPVYRTNLNSAEQEDFNRENKNLKDKTHSLNRLIAQYPESFSVQSDYAPLINDINRISHMADSTDRWKLNRLTADISKKTARKGPQLQSIEIPLISSEIQIFQDAPIPYEEIKSWGGIALTKDPRHMIYWINQFFAKGCLDEKTTKLTECITNLNSKDDSKRSQLTDNEEQKITQHIRTITDNKHFQTVSQFIVDGVHFPKKEFFIAALNALGTKQYKDPKSKSSSATKILAGTGIILTIAAFFVYLWKNHPDFFSTTPFSSLRA